MRRIALLIAMPLLAANASAGDSLRIDSQLLVVGESAIRAVELLGQPAYKEPIESSAGGYVGERWQYPFNGRVVTLTVISGKVRDIEDRAR